MKADSMAETCLTAEIDTADAEAAAEPHETAFAHEQGYATYTEMIGSSQPLTSTSGALWYLTPRRDGQWVAWTVNYLDGGHLCPTFDAALRLVHDMS